MSSHEMTPVLSASSVETVNENQTENINRQGPSQDYLPKKQQPMSEDDIIPIIEDTEPLHPKNDKKKSCCQDCNCDYYDYQTSVFCCILWPSDYNSECCGNGANDCDCDCNC
jgi:hypothetical protein